MLTVVSQKFGQKDCVIACVATLCGQTYDEAARLLGVEMKNGKPSLPNGGLHGWETIYAFARCGFVAGLLTVRNAEQTTDSDAFPTSDEIKPLLKRRLAMLCYTDPDIGPHAVVWDGENVIDCNDWAPKSLKLECISLTSAVILAPLPDCLQSSP